MSDAANPLLAALTIARNQLRDCYWWRNLVSEVTPWNQAQAEARIYFDELPPPVSDDYTPAELTALRPFALLWLDTASGLQLMSESSGNCCWIPSGTAIAQIEIPVPPNLAATPNALALDLHSKIGRIIRTADPTKPGLCDLAGVPGYLPVKQVIYRGYIRTDVKAAAEIGDCVRCEIEMQWGAN